MSAMARDGFDAWGTTDDSAFVQPSLYVPLTTSLVPTLATGSGVPTYTRADAANYSATVTDFEGLIKPVKTGEARFEGARRVENYLTKTEDLNNASWTKASAGGPAIPTVSTVSGVTLPDGTVGSVTKVVYPAVSVVNSFSIIFQILSIAHLTNTFVGSVWIRGESGSGTVFLDLEDTVSGPAAGNYGTSTANFTTSWKRFSNKTTYSSGTGNLAYLIGFDTRNSEPQTTSGVTIYIWGAQAENVTGQSNQNPSEYVSVGVNSAPYFGANVDGVKYFSTYNGNTVAGNVVTEATGAQIPDATLHGYVAEGARQNLAKYSEQFDNAVWLKSLAVITPDTVTSPGGTITADTFTRNVTGNNEAIIRYTTTQAVNTTYTISVYAKKGNQNWLRLRNISYDGATSLQQSAWFNLNTGVIGTKGSALTSSNITSIGNGWYRCSITMTTSATITNNLFDIGQDDEDGGLAGGTFSGTNGDYIYLWGAQLEAGAFASSYIPTTAVTLSRNSDVLTYPQGLPANGSAYAEAAISSAIGTETSLHGRIIDAGNSYAPLSVAKSYVLDGYDGSYDLQMTVPSFRGTVRRVASSWSNSLRIRTLFANGVNSGTTPRYNGNYSSTGVTHVGQYATGGTDSSLFGTIRNVKIWPKTLRDNRLIDMTTPGVADLG